MVAVVPSARLAVMALVETDRWLLVPAQVAVAVTRIGWVRMVALMPRTVAVPATLAERVSVPLLMVACCTVIVASMASARSTARWSGIVVAEDAARVETGRSARIRTNTTSGMRKSQRCMAD